MSVGPLECRFCKMRFKINCSLNQHLRQHYNKYECLRCGLICCLESTALLHEEYHSGVKRKCPHCDSEFRHLSTFYTHLRTHRSKHMCSLCGDSFVSQLGLRFHRKAKHQVESKNTVVDVDGAIFCEICKINFESESAYQNHLAHSALHAQVNQPMDKNLDAEMLEAEKKIERQEDADTHVKALVNRKSMVENELCAERKRLGYSSRKRYMDENPISCQHVNSMPTHMNKHTRRKMCKSKRSITASNEVKNHLVCDASCDSSSACLKHNQSEHRRKAYYTKRIICEICGASLAMNSVAAHRNTHTRSKMFTCDTCGRSFTNSNILKNHLVAKRITLVLSAINASRKKPASISTTGRSILSNLIAKGTEESTSKRWSEDII